MRSKELGGIVPLSTPYSESLKIMPSKSPAQARLMAAAAHTKGGYGGVPQSVGKEFNQADTGSALLSRATKKKRGKKKK